MPETVDHSQAKKELLNALVKPCLRDDSLTEKIRFVLHERHKTYKYILVNALLAKATNGDIHPLALQAGAELEGAFDARSLCHKVLVPFEREHLDNVLGGSNEPFLNKPARFTHLSTENAVRAGTDKKILATLIDVLSNVKSSSDAQEYLTCALEILTGQIEALRELNTIEGTFSQSVSEALTFIKEFVSVSHEGESTVIIVAAIEKLFHSRLAGEHNVKPHKVNQSGASSKEVGDIDVFHDDAFVYAIEVKDKDFTAQDVAHAFDKMKHNNASRGIFIYGPHASFNREVIEGILETYHAEGFTTLLMGIVPYARLILIKTGLESRDEFFQVVMQTAIEINSKQETREWIQALVSKAASSNTASW